MKNEFGEWVQQMIDERGWSQSELARRAGTTSTTVSRVINKERLPGIEFCRGIAKAFGLPEIDVLRLAGLASPARAQSTLRDKLVIQLGDMTEEQLGAMERYARALLAEQMMESLRGTTSTGSQSRPHAKPTKN